MGKRFGKGFKKYFGKEGEAVTTTVGFVVIGLILAAIVSLIFFQKAIDDLNGTTYEKNYFARDLALALDAVYAAPGSIEYTYSMRSYRFDIEVKDSRVFVKKSLCDKNEVPGVYDFFGYAGSDADNGADNELSGVITSKAANTQVPMLLVFVKKDGMVSVRADGNAEFRNEPLC